MEGNVSTNFADETFAFLAKHLYYPPLAGLIPLPYVIPSFALDIFVNYVLIRHFKTPFYRLYVYSNFVQCFAWFTTYYLFRASTTPFFYPLYGLIPPTGWIPTLLNFLTYYVIYVNYFLQFLLSFNRFTVVAFPFSYTELWDRIMPYLMLFTFSYPFLFTWHLIRTGATITLMPTGYMIDACECLTGISNSLYYVIITSIYGISVASMNIYICIKLFLRRKQRRGSILVSRPVIETEHSLFLLTCFLFIFAMFVAFCQVYIHFNIKSMGYQAWNVVFIELYIEDLHLVLSPWFLIMLSSGLQKKIRSIFGQESKANRILIRSTVQSTQFDHS